MRQIERFPPDFDPLADAHNADAAWIRRRELIYERALGPLRQPAVYHWDDDGNPHIDVYVIARADGRPYETLVTGGMSDRVQPGVAAGDGLPRRVELMLKLPQAADWAAMVLREIASLPFLFGVRLSAGVLVRGSRPVRPGATVRHVLLGPAEEPGLADFSVDGEAVEFLLAQPVTEAELRHGVARGGRGLLRLLRRRGVGPVCDPDRASIL
jgi:hypothetical protein